VAVSLAAALLQFPTGSPSSLLLLRLLVLLVLLLLLLLLPRSLSTLLSHFHTPFPPGERTRPFPLLAQPIVCTHTSKPSRVSPSSNTHTNICVSRFESLIEIINNKTNCFLLQFSPNETLLRTRILAGHCCCCSCCCCPECCWSCYYCSCCPGSALS